MERDVYTVREVAQMLGLHQQTVWRRIREGKIPGGEWDGDRYWIWKQQFDAARMPARKPAERTEERAA